MENTAQKQFLKWRAGKVKENYVFDFRKEFLESDVWLTVHRNSVWIRKTN